MGIFGALRMGKLIVGYPKCVCAKPFTLVHTPLELREYTAKNPNWNKPKAEAAPKPKAELKVK